MITYFTKLHTQSGETTQKQSLIWLESKLEEKGTVHVIQQMDGSNIELNSYVVEPETPIL